MKKYFSGLFGQNNGPGRVGAQSGLGPCPGWGPKENRKTVCKNQKFAWLGFKIGFLKKFLDRSVSFLRQETHEHVKTIKKRCLEAKNMNFSQSVFRKGMFSRRVSLPGVRRPIEGCFV